MKKLFILLICLVFTGCKYNVFNLEENEEICFCLPQWSLQTDSTKVLPEFSRWKVQVTSADFVQSFYTTDSSISLSLKKNEPAAISVTPVTFTSFGEESIFFKPAGLIYPYEERFSWEGGFTVQIFETLYNSKKETGVTTKHMMEFLKTFNWKKMTETICKNVEASRADFFDSECKTPKFYNPWQIDIYTLLDNLCYGNFKAGFLNTKEIYEVEAGRVGVGGEDIFSSFVPENLIIQDYEKISLKKGQLSCFLYQKDYELIITYNSSKNISQEVVFLPIFKEEI